MFVEVIIGVIILSLFLLLIINISVNRSVNKDTIRIEDKVKGVITFNYNLSSPLWLCPIYKYMETNYTSQFFEEKFVIDYYIKNNISAFNRIYLEVGAFDGYDMSNTYALEHGYGWRGLLIEASPTVFARLSKTNRPRSIKVNKAICGIEGVVEYIDEDTGHGGVKMFKNNEYGNKKVLVQCSPIKRIIEENGIKYIDVFSLDVEGGEESVLNTFDWNIPVRIWIIEVNAIKQGGNEEEKLKCKRVINILKRHGYIFLGISSSKSVNEFYYDPHFDEKIKDFTEEEKRIYGYKKCKI